MSGPAPGERRIEAHVRAEHARGPLIQYWGARGMGPLPPRSVAVRRGLKGVREMCVCRGSCLRRNDGCRRLSEGGLDGRDVVGDASHPSLILRVTSALTASHWGITLTPALSGRGRGGKFALHHTSGWIPALGGGNGGGERIMDGRGFGRLE